MRRFSLATCGVFCSSYCWQAPLLFLFVFDLFVMAFGEALSQKATGSSFPSFWSAAISAACRLFLPPSRRLLFFNVLSDFFCLVFLEPYVRRSTWSTVPPFPFYPPPFLLALYERGGPFPFPPFPKRPMFSMDN